MRYYEDPLKSPSTYSYLAPKLAALVVAKHLVLILFYLMLQLHKVKIHFKKVCKFGCQGFFGQPIFTIFDSKSLFSLVNGYYLQNVFRLKSSCN